MGAVPTDPIDSRGGWSGLHCDAVCVWAFGQNNNTTFRNWARSQLIMAGIGLVIGILVLAAVVALGVSLVGMSEFSEGATEYYSYY